MLAHLVAHPTMQTMKSDKECAPAPTNGACVDYLIRPWIIPDHSLSVPYFPRHNSGSR